MSLIVENAITVLKNPETEISLDEDFKNNDLGRIANLEASKVEQNV